MKLLLVSHSGGFYGAEKSLLTVAKGLSERGHDVCVVVPNQGKLREELKRENISVTVWRYYGWLGRENRISKGAFRFIFNLISGFWFFVAKKPKFDFIYTNTVTTPFGVIVSFFSRTKHIWHVREFVHEDMGAEFDLPKKITSFLYFLNFWCSIYNSVSVQKKFQGYFGTHKSEVIYNAIELPDKTLECHARELSEIDAVKLSMVSSLHEGKGHVDAIHALPHVLRRYPNCVLSIVGSGNDEYVKSIKKLIFEKRLENNIELLGYMDNPLHIMAESDAFLMCSRNEAFGRVTLEAMSIGCPVVGARSGGTQELLEYGKYGLLYKPGDCDDLGEKILVLLLNKHSREKYSRISKKKALDFSSNAVVDGIVNVLENTATH
jgi:glycosyltransferase involved in cell wall biosynthesis